MNISEQFESHTKSQSKDHFIHLVQVALADGKIDQAEMELLFRIGVSKGLVEPEIEALIESTKKAVYQPPYELSQRFEQVYETVKMMLADGKIENAEMKLVTSFALKSGFNENEIPGILILLMDGVKKGADVDDLFEIYKKKRIKPS